VADDPELRLLRSPAGRRAARRAAANQPYVRTALLAVSAASRSNFGRVLILVGRTFGDDRAPHPIHF